ncbi:MAG: thioredoxin family protein [Armatimonadota bacterium]
MNNRWAKAAVIILLVVAVAGVLAFKAAEKRPDTKTSVKQTQTRILPSSDNSARPDDSGLDQIRADETKNTSAEAMAAKPDRSSTEGSQIKADKTASAGPSRDQGKPIAKQENALAPETATTTVTKDSPVRIPKLLDLGASKCIPCKMMVPVLEELSKEYRGKLRVEFVDVWENPEVAQKLNIRGIPTQIFYDADGKELWRHEGYISKEDIIAKFAELGIKLDE